MVRAIKTLIGTHMLETTIGQPPALFRGTMADPASQGSGQYSKCYTVSYRWQLFRQRRLNSIYFSRREDRLE